MPAVTTLDDLIRQINDASKPLDLLDGATINTNASLASNFRVTLAGNRTLANPTKLTDGQKLAWRIKQDATGNRTLAYGSMFKFSGSSTLSTAANAVDKIEGQYYAAENTILCVLTKAFA